MSKEPAKKPGQDISHRGALFRVPGRSMWHTEAHREYGVVWSLCGIRAVLLQSETKAALDEGDTPCTKCAGRR